MPPIYVTANPDSLAVAAPGTESQQYYFRQRLGNRVPAGDGLCWFCVAKPAPQSEDERVDRRISVQRLVLTAMRSPRQ